jgi:hypothetical protein
VEGRGRGFVVVICVLMVSDIRIRYLTEKLESKVFPLHATKALGETGSIDLIGPLH